MEKKYEYCNLLSFDTASDLSHRPKSFLNAKRYAKNSPSLVLQLMLVVSSLISDFFSFVFEYVCLLIKAIIVFYMDNH